MSDYQYSHVRSYSKWGHTPHAPTLRRAGNGYRFVHKTPIRVVLLSPAITRRGSLFGMFQGFVLPSLFGFDFLGEKRPPCDKHLYRVECPHLKFRPCQRSRIAAPAPARQCGSNGGSKPPSCTKLSDKNQIRNACQKL
ncbi:conserved domain protein [Ruminococcus albus 8]|uniref:Conserved domain protein n=1 Tax=Ruminococcus albus 8 TaxID=246199 RepID=E9S9H2_RUMAL|nr:conserved domain protein [Ruminococcus albus 8]